jgi:hypothetical protein
MNRWVRVCNPNMIIEIDAEVGRLSNDLEASQHFREETTRWTKFCLGLSSDGCSTPENRIVAFFKVIGDATVKAYGFRKFYTMIA